MHRLHGLDVVVDLVGHGVRHLAGLEGGDQAGGGVADGVARHEAQLAADLLRGDVVAAVVVGRRGAISTTRPVSLPTTSRTMLAISVTVWFS